MLLLTGEYEHTIDDKNRLFITNKLRSPIDSQEYGSDFFLTLGANGILCLYPEKCYQQIVFAGAPGTGAPDESVAFERLSFALASKVELDRQGRLLIPEKMKKRAKLGNKITLVGVRDHIEVWNTQDWENYLTDHANAYQQQVAEARKTVMEKQSQEIES